jgi:hypothetical protein
MPSIVERSTFWSMDLPCARERSERCACVWGSKGG